jgi:ribosomal protein L37AE/L43A
VKRSYVLSSSLPTRPSSLTGSLLSPSAIQKRQSRPIIAIHVPPAEFFVTAPPPVNTREAELFVTRNSFHHDLSETGSQDSCCPTCIVESYNRVAQTLYVCTHESYPESGSQGAMTGARSHPGLYQIMKQVAGLTIKSTPYRSSRPFSGTILPSAVSVVIRYPALYQAAARPS